jgi:zinc/manganese transport system permease protein
LGLAASAMFNAPPSFLIVTIVTAVWLVVWLRDRSIHRNEPAPHC